MLIRNYSDQWQVGKKPSLRLNIFGGKNSGHKRKQMERQKSIMVLSEEMVCPNFCMIHKCILNFLRDQHNQLHEANLTWMDFSLL